MTEVNLDFSQVHFTYPDSEWSLDIPSLSLGKERLTCLVGPNGSGKSTIIRLAAGILSPGNGSVQLNHVPLAHRPRRELAQTIGYLPQESPSLYDYTVDMVARMGRYIHTGWTGAMTPRDEQSVECALRCVDLENKRHRPLGRLSGGERRRALIASVLAQQPRFLLLDEPTASLDVHHAASVMRLLSNLAPSCPQVVLVTHDINLAALFAQRMILLVDGKIVVDGTPHEVMQPSWMTAAYGPDVLVRSHPELDIPMLLPSRVCGSPQGESGHA